jgi:hypothetical protein
MLLAENSGNIDVILIIIRRKNMKMPNSQKKEIKKRLTDYVEKKVFTTVLVLSEETHISSLRYHVRAGITDASFILKINGVQAAGEGKNPISVYAKTCSAVKKMIRKDNDKTRDRQISNFRKEKQKRRAAAASELFGENISAEDLEYDPIFDELGHLYCEDDFDECLYDAYGRDDNIRDDDSYFDDPDYDFFEEPRRALTEEERAAYFKGLLNECGEEEEPPEEPYEYLYDIFQAKKHLKMCY